VYKDVAGHEYTDFTEELKHAEEKLQQFTIEQEKREAELAEEAALEQEDHEPEPDILSPEPSQDLLPSPQSKSGHMLKEG